MITIASIIAFYLFIELSINKALSKRVGIGLGIKNLYFIIDAVLHFLLAYWIYSELLLIEIWGTSKILSVILYVLLLVKTMFILEDIRATTALKFPTSLKKKYEESISKYVEEYIKNSDILEGEVMELMNWFFEIVLTEPEESLEELRHGKDMSEHTKKINAKYNYKNLLAIENKFKIILRQEEENLKNLELFIDNQKEIFTSLIKNNEEKYYAYVELNKVNSKILKRIFTLKKELLEEVTAEVDRAKVEYYSYLDSFTESEWSEINEE